MFGLTSFAPVALLAVSGAPLVAYNAVTFIGDSFWSRTYGAQNVLPSPALHELIVDLGILILVGIPAMIALWRRNGWHRRLAIALAVILVLMYAPVPFQRRLGFGVAPLLGIVAGAAISQFVSTDGAARLRRFGGVLAAALTLGSPSIVYLGMLASSMRNEPLPVYRVSTDLAETRQWLANNSTATDVVIAPWDVMNYLAGAIPGRTIGGHPVATLDTSARKGAIDSMFRSASDDETPTAVWLARPQSAWIYCCPVPPSLLVSVGTPPEPMPSDTRLVHRSGDVDVWRLASVP